MSQKAEKLRNLADNMQDVIDDKLRCDRLEDTARRQRIAAGVRQDGYKLQQIQSCLYALAEAHESGDIVMKPPQLAKVSRKTEVETLLRGYNHYWTKTWDGTPPFDKPDSYDFDSVKRANRLGISNADEFRLCQEALKNMVEGRDRKRLEERKKQEELKRLEQRIQPGNIPGFFPTSQEIIELMLQEANIQIGETICEPQAGKGNIADVIRDRYSSHTNHLSCFEVHYNLQEILKAKGHNVCGANWLSSEYDDRRYDVIIQNPPWGKGVPNDNQDFDHVRKSYARCNRVLVSLFNAGLKFRTDQRYKDFRLWLKSVGGVVKEIPAFDRVESGTSAQGVMIVIRKKEAIPAIAPPESLEPKVLQYAHSHEENLEWLHKAIATLSREPISKNEIENLLAEVNAPTDPKSQLRQYLGTKLFNEMEVTIATSCFNDWRSHPARENALKRSLLDVIGEEAIVSRIFPLIKSCQDY